MAETQNSENTQNADATPIEASILDLARGMLKGMQMEGEKDARANEVLELLANGGTMADLHGLDPDDLVAWVNETLEAQA